MSKIAFIGMGVMGYPMAGHIRTKGGHDLTVFNRTLGKAQAWVAEFGGHMAPTPEEAAKDADFVFTCVGNDDDLRAVTLGERGAFQALKPGAIVIDNTTASAGVARELYAAAGESGATFPMRLFQAARPALKTAFLRSWWAATPSPSRWLSPSFRSTLAL